MYGIKAAVRRLEFAPDLEAMEVTDLQNGRFVFPPRPGKPVSLSALEAAITKAGYAIEGARIEVSGTLTPEGRLRVSETGQVFRLEGEERLRKLREKAAEGGTVTVSGAWKVVDQQEAVVLEEPRTEAPHP